MLNKIKLNRMKIMLDADASLGGEWADSKNCGPRQRLLGEICQPNYFKSERKK